MGGGRGRGGGMPGAGKKQGPVHAAARQAAKLLAEAQQLDLKAGVTSARDEALLWKKKGYMVSDAYLQDLGKGDFKVEQGLAPYQTGLQKKLTALLELDVKESLRLKARAKEEDDELSEEIRSVESNAQQNRDYAKNEAERVQVEVKRAQKVSLISKEKKSREQEDMRREGALQVEGKRKAAAEAVKDLQTAQQSWEEGLLGDAKKEKGELLDSITQHAKELQDAYETQLKGLEEDFVKHIETKEEAGRVAAEANAALQTAEEASLKAEARREESSSAATVARDLAVKVKSMIQPKEQALAASKEQRLQSLKVALEELEVQKDDILTAEVQEKEGAEKQLNKRRGEIEEYKLNSQRPLDLQHSELEQRQKKRKHDEAREAKNMESMKEKAAKLKERAAKLRVDYEEEKKKTEGRVDLETKAMQDKKEKSIREATAKNTELERRNALRLKDAEEEFREAETSVLDQRKAKRKKIAEVWQGYKEEADAREGTAAAELSEASGAKDSAEEEVRNLEEGFAEVGRAFEREVAKAEESRENAQAASRERVEELQREVEDKRSEVSAHQKVLDAAKKAGQLRVAKQGEDIAKMESDIKMAFNEKRREMKEVLGQSIVKLETEIEVTRGETQRRKEVAEQDYGQFRTLNGEEASALEASLKVYDEFQAVVSAENTRLTKEQDSFEKEYASTCQALQEEEVNLTQERHKKLEAHEIAQAAALQALEPDFAKQEAFVEKASAEAQARIAYIAKETDRCSAHINTLRHKKLTLEKSLDEQQEKVVSERNQLAKKAAEVTEGKFGPLIDAASKVKVAGLDVVLAPMQMKHPVEIVAQEEEGAVLEYQWATDESNIVQSQLKFLKDRVANQKKARVRAVTEIGDMQKEEIMHEFEAMLDFLNSRRADVDKRITQRRSLHHKALESLEAARMKAAGDLNLLKMTSDEAHGSFRSRERELLQVVRKLELQDAAALQDLEKRKKLLISNASVHEERIDTEENDRLRTVRERENALRAARRDEKRVFRELEDEHLKKEKDVDAVLEKIKDEEALQNGEILKCRRFTDARHGAFKTENEVAAAALNVGKASLAAASEVHSKKVEAKDAIVQEIAARLALFEKDDAEAQEHGQKTLQTAEKRKQGIEKEVAQAQKEVEKNEKKLEAQLKRLAEDLDSIKQKATKELDNYKNRYDECVENHKLQETKIYEEGEKTKELRVQRDKAEFEAKKAIREKETAASGEAEKQLEQSMLIYKDNVVKAESQKDHKLRALEGKKSELMKTSGVAETKEETEAKKIVKMKEDALKVELNADEAERVAELAVEAAKKAAETLEVHTEKSGEANLTLKRSKNILEIEKEKLVKAKKDLEEHMEGERVKFSTETRKKIVVLERSVLEKIEAKRLELETSVVELNKDLAEFAAEVDTRVSASQEDLQESFKDVDEELDSAVQDIEDASRVRQEKVRKAQAQASADRKKAREVSAKRAEDRILKFEVDIGNGLEDCKKLFKNLKTALEEHNQDVSQMRNLERSRMEAAERRQVEEEALRLQQKANAAAEAHRMKMLRETELQRKEAELSSQRMQAEILARLEQQKLETMQTIENKRQEMRETLEKEYLESQKRIKEEMERLESERLKRVAEAFGSGGENAPPIAPRFAAPAGRPPSGGAPGRQRSVRRTSTSRRPSAALRNLKDQKNKEMAEFEAERAKMLSEMAAMDAELASI